MSFYFSDFGASASIQALTDAVNNARAEGIRTDNAVRQADMAVQAASTALIAAKARNTFLNKMDGDWFEAFDSKPVSAEERPYYDKYRYTFHMKPDGSGPDYQKGSDALYADQMASWGAVNAAEDAFAGAKASLQAAKVEAASAMSAFTAAEKQLATAVKAEEVAAAAAAAAAARVKAQAEAKAKGGGSSDLSMLFGGGGETSAGKKVLIGVAVVVPLLGLLAFALKKKPAAVAGYRRRRSRR